MIDVYIFQQECLIRQLQEQHYQQYMSQVYAQQALNDEKLAAAAADGDNDGLAQCHQTIDRRDSSDASDDDVPGDDLPCKMTCFDLCHKFVSSTPYRSILLPLLYESIVNVRFHNYVREYIYFAANPAISPASMWTRKDTIDFKNAIKKEGSDGVIKVGHGETVTVILSILIRII
jgi:hypothetical protein